MVTCGVNEKRAGLNLRPLRAIRSYNVRSGPFGSIGNTTMFVCINRSGSPSGKDIGAVVRAIGSNAARNSLSDVSAGIDPTPDDPANVKCGGLSFANFGSYFS